MFFIFISVYLVIKKRKRIPTKYQYSGDNYNELK
jgi:hypothetical protein